MIIFDATPHNAQNPIDTFSRNFPVDAKVANLPNNCYGLVLLVTRQTILKCQDVANKSTTSPQQVCCVVVMEFGKRHDRHNGLLPAPACYGFATEKLATGKLLTFCGRATRKLM